MSDVAEVKEALAQYDDGEAGTHQVSALAAAARRWVRVVSTGEVVWMCKRHKNAVVQTGTFPPDTCWAFWADADSCLMEPRLLAGVGAVRETADGDA